jgi:hypothetical protein
MKSSRGSDKRKRPGQAMHAIEFAMTRKFPDKYFIYLGKMNIPQMTEWPKPGSPGQCV